MVGAETASPLQNEALLDVPDGSKLRFRVLPHEPVSDIDTVVVDSLKALDPEWPIREADIDEQVLALPGFRSRKWHDHITENLVGGWASAVRGTRCYESLRNPKSAGSSFWFDAGFLDDWPPLLNLGLLQSAQRFRRLLLAGENLLSEFSKSRTNWRLG